VAAVRSVLLTHDLQELVDTLKHASIALPPFMDSAFELTPYAVASRYPGQFADVSRSDVDEAIALAQKILDFAGNIIA
jgi:HEPN domain-containing protein